MTERKQLQARAQDLRDQIRTAERELKEVERKLDGMGRLDKLQQLLEEAQPDMHYLINLNNLAPNGELRDFLFGVVDTERDSKHNDQVMDENKVSDEARVLFQELQKRFRFIPADVTYNYSTVAAVTIEQSMDGEYELELNDVEFKGLPDVSPKHHSTAFYVPHDPNPDEVGRDDWDCDGKSGCRATTTVNHEGMGDWVVLK